MIVVDASAIVSIALEEQDFERVLSAMADVEHIELSMAGYLETALVLRRKGTRFNQDAIDLMLAQLGVTLVEVDRVQIDLAVKAEALYGKGTRHPAKLNFGDCFAYALAKSRQAPLLFVGDDFSRTDLKAVLK